MSRTHNAWVALGRPRRRGTAWIETGVLVIFFVVWLAFAKFVFEPDVSNNSPVVFAAWVMVPSLAWTVWMVWFRNHRPDPVEPEVPRLDASLPAGMVYPSEWRPPHKLRSGR